jgi:hypothetical protein
MREWLHETHGPTFELFRHFLLRFFDSDLVTSPGQTGLALIGSSTMFLTWFPFFTGPLKDKYKHLSALATPEPYRLALRADHLWLIVMLMSAIGLLTAIKWQSLFPSLADYRVIGPMPVRARQIFAAKLAALLVVATGAVLVLDLLPSAGFPALAGGRWALPHSARALLLATVAGSYFTFFAIVALQGLLLNLLSARRFRQVTGTLQGILAATMLGLLVMSFSIGPPVLRAVMPFGKWLPPVWFLALCESLSGDPDPLMRTLANYATSGLHIAIWATILAYLLSYRRHQILMMEGVTAPRRDRRWRTAIFDRFVPDSRQKAIVFFLWKGLTTDGPHRMILMGYLGFALALVLTGTVDARITLLTFLFIGLRHLFSIPVELRANWQLRITESEGRREWATAVDRFVFCLAALTLISFKWRELPLEAAYGLACYEVVFSDFRKLPFTCSYLPGKKPVWMVALRLFALLVFLPLMNALFRLALVNPLIYIGLLAAFLITWYRLRCARREAWAELPLKYDEVPDPAVDSLNLLRN